MDWAQFEDPLCCMCHAVNMVASWSLTQEVAGTNNLLKYNFMSMNSVKIFRENSNVLQMIPAALIEVFCVQT